MSKAPVRAAFIELRDKGLVSVVPQSGTYVFSPTVDDVRTMSHFRALLEDEALHESQQTAGRPPCSARLARGDCRHEARHRRPRIGKATRRHDSAYHFAFLEESGNAAIEKAHSLTSTALEALRVRLQRAGEGKFPRQILQRAPRHCRPSEGGRVGASRRQRSCAPTS